MFKNDKTNDFKEAETIIGPSVKVEGDFIGQGNLIIDGIINGSVSTEGNLKVGDQAKITASVKANNGFISGEIYGDVIIQNDLELTANAKISGDIEAKSISIARGAVLNGKITMNKTGKKETIGTLKNIQITEEEINEEKSGTL